MIKWLTQILRGDVATTAEEVPNVERRFTIQGMVAIIIVLAGVIAFLFKDSNKIKKQTFDAVVAENEVLRKENAAMQSRYDSLKDSKYKDMLSQATEFLRYHDSVNNQLSKIKQTL